MKHSLVDGKQLEMLREILVKLDSIMEKQNKVLNPIIEPIDVGEPPKREEPLKREEPPKPTLVRIPPKPVVLPPEPMKTAYTPDGKPIPWNERTQKEANK